MNWLAISILAYFLIALQIILDKFLLSSRRISHPAVYAFYSGILSSFALILAPWGFGLIGGAELALCFFSGIVFIYGMLFLFFAIRAAEASRATLVAGAATPIATYFLAYLILGDRLNFHQFLGVALLISGGLWISYDFRAKRKKKFFSGFYYSVFSGIFLAAAFTLFKNLYENNAFINIYIWTRLGLVAGSLSLFLFSGWRKAILASITKFKKPEKENKRSGTIFVLNKIFGGTGSIALNWAIALGSVTVVNAMVSLEYIFIFILGLIFAHWFPGFFQESRKALEIFQKVSAIIVIGLGILLASGF